MTHHWLSDPLRLSWAAEDGPVAVVLRRCYSSHSRRQHRQSEPRPAASQRQQSPQGGLQRCGSLRRWWWERRTRVDSGLGDEDEEARDDGSSDGCPMGNNESADKGRRRPPSAKKGSALPTSSTKSRPRATLMSSSQHTP